MSSLIHENTNSIIKVKWERNNNQVFEKNILTGSTNVLKDGKIVNIGIIGISPNFIINDVNFFQSLIIGIEQTYSWIDSMLSSLVALVKGEISLDNMSGPLGIAKVAGDAGSEGIAARADGGGGGVDAAAGICVDGVAADAGAAGALAEAQ